MVRISYLLVAFFFVFFFSSQAQEVDNKGKLNAFQGVSFWQKKALQGWHQSKIESFLLTHLEPNTLEEVKGVLRKALVAKLEALGMEERPVRDQDDLSQKTATIRQELRFFGLEEDTFFKRSLEKRFKVAL